MVIVHVFSDGWSELNSSVWRGKIPSDALRRAGHTVYMPHVDDWFRDTPEVRYWCSLADLIVVQRVLVEEAIDRVRFWRDKHKALVVDCDDAYHLLKSEKESFNRASTFWYDGKVEIKYATGASEFRKLDRHPQDQFITGGKLASGFTMPSRILAEEWQWINKCWYIPNFIDSGRYLPHRRQDKGKPGELLIGWGGSLSHVVSFRDSGVLEALRRVFLQRKNVKFLLCGDERIVPMLPIPADRKIYQPYVTWRDWPIVLNRFDIGIAPLHGRYDHSRSYIKTAEYSIMGIPFVATGCPTYQEFMDEGLGLYVNDGETSEKKKRADEWEAALLDLIDNWESHKAALDADFDTAMSFDVDRNVDYLVETYSEIVKRG